MKLARSLVALAVLSGAMLCMAAAPARAVLLTTDPHTYPVTSKHRIRLEFPIGQLRVEPTDDSRVRFEIRVRCDGRDEDRCEELANQLTLDSDDTGGTLHLKLNKFPKWHNHGMKVMGTLSVPRSLAIDIEMGVGELDIRGMEGDIDVDLGVGEVDIQASKTQANRVSVDSGTATPSAAVAAARACAASSARTPSGPTATGRSSVHLHVGVGEATVRWVSLRQIRPRLSEPPALGPVVLGTARARCAAAPR
jgi:hypothetical protein